MCIARWVGKEDVARVHRGVSAIQKVKIMPFASTWMQLEIIILSEASQKEKDKY